MTEEKKMDWNPNNHSREVRCTIPVSLVSQYVAEGERMNRSPVEVMEGQLARRYENKANEVVEDQVHIVLTHRGEKSWKSTVQGVYSNRQSAELFLDSFLQNMDEEKREEAWVISLPLNTGILRWWSVRYQWEHKVGWSAMPAPNYRMDNPYVPSYFENGVSVMVAADTEEGALARGRALIKGAM